MDNIAAALADGSRWRIIELLAERPRSVGELAQLTELRQPQTTKHLQALARAGLVSVFPLGQRRVYAVETAPLQNLANQLRRLSDTAEANRGEREVVAHYQAAIEAESTLADRDRWADGRAFVFERSLCAPPEAVWRHWTTPRLLASWWAPPSMTIADCRIEPRPGGRAVLEYRDPEGRRYRSEGSVHTAVEPERLAFDLAVLDAAGRISFTGRYDIGFTATPGGTRLRIDLYITDTTVDAVAFIAGIETGWRQVLDNLAEAIGHHMDAQEGLPS